MKRLTAVTGGLSTAAQDRTKPSSDGHNTSMDSGTSSLASSSRRQIGASARPPTAVSHGKKPAMLSSLRRLRSAGSATSDHTPQTLAETDEASHSSSNNYYSYYYQGGTQQSNSSVSASPVHKQKQRHGGGAGSVQSSSSRIPYYPNDSYTATQYLPCETERPVNPARCEDACVFRTGPVDVDEMLPLVDVEDHKRIISGPVDLDEWEDALSDSSDDSSDLLFTIDYDLDEQDYDVRLMGYVAGFEPPVINHWTPTTSSPVSNYAARRKFSQDAIPRPIIEERSVATPSRAPISVASKRASPPSSSASHLTSSCHNCGGRNGECLGSKFCI